MIRTPPVLVIGYRMDAKHSLFTTKYATINMDTVFTASKENTERIITVINTNTQQMIDNNNTNVTAVINKFQELRQDIRDEFDRLGDSFNTIIEEGMMMMMMGSAWKDSIV